MNLLIFVAVVCFFSGTPVVYGQNCLVPSPLENQSSFTMRSSLLQVFNSLVIPCDGTLIAWTFVPRVATVNDLYLAVFRSFQGSTSYYNMVGYTKIHNYTVPVVNQWVRYPVPNTFQVQRNDVLAVFYENWQLLASGAAIPVTEPPLGGNTLVDTHDINTINQQMASNNQQIIDLSGATRTIRLAAIQAEIFSGPVTTTTTTVSTTPTTTTTTAAVTTPPTTPSTTSPSTTTTTTTTTTTATPTTTTQDDGLPCDYSDYDTSTPSTSTTRQSSPAGTTTPAYMRCLQQVKAMESCSIMYYEEKWFFRPETNSCQLIWWFPYCMTDNGNLFQTLEECEMICSRYLAFQRIRNW